MQNNINSPIVISYETGSGGQTFDRITTFKKVWIPFNNQKYHYAGNNDVSGRDYDIAAWVTAYDSSNDLSLDNIGTISLAYELFYKDA